MIKDTSRIKLIFKYEIKGQDVTRNFIIKNNFYSYYIYLQTIPNSKRKGKSLQLRPPSLINITKIIIF